MPLAILGRSRNAHTGHPAFALWLKEIDAVLGTGASGKVAPATLHALYDQGLPSSRAAAVLAAPAGLPLAKGSPTMVGWVRTHTGWALAHSGWVDTQIRTHAGQFAPPFTPCPPGQYWNSAAEKCEPKIVFCPPGQSWDPATQRCGYPTVARPLPTRAFVHAGQIAPPQTLPPGLVPSHVLQPMVPVPVPTPSLPVPGNPFGVAPGLVPQHLRHLVGADPGGDIVCTEYYSPDGHKHAYCAPTGPTGSARSAVPGHTGASGGGDLVCYDYTKPDGTEGITCRMQPPVTDRGMRSIVPGHAGWVLTGARAKTRPSIEKTGWVATSAVGCCGSAQAGAKDPPKVYPDPSRPPGCTMTWECTPKAGGGQDCHFTYSCP